MPDWKPIETAPKDGTAILAHCVWGDDRSVPYGALTLVWMDFRGGYWGLAGCNSIQVDSDSDPSDQIIPTHWMPLPPPPVSGPEA